MKTSITQRSFVRHVFFSLFITLIPAISSAQFNEAPVTQDRITFFYEQPLIHFEYNRYRPDNTTVYVGTPIPITLETKRPRPDFWIDVRVDWDQSDGISFSSWYYSDQGEGYNTEHTYNTTGQKVVTFEIKFWNTLGQESKLVQYHDTLTVIPQPTKFYSGNGSLTFWQSGVLDKPVLLLEGFDPLNEHSAYYNYQLGGALVQAALNNGYDIFIADWSNGGAPIQDNATTVFKDMLHFIYNLFPDSTEVCIQTVGVSMGGLIARYGLASIEGENKDSTLIDKHHYTNTFISFDAPQQGAHINNSLLNFLRDEPLITAEQKSIINNSAARQMLYNNPYGSVHDAFYAECRNLNNQTLGQPNANGGYPMLTKNYALSNGNYQRVDTRTPGVDELGIVKKVGTVQGGYANFHLRWVEVRFTDQEYRFLVEQRDVWPGSRFTNDIRELNRYDLVNPFDHIFWYQTLGWLLFDPLAKFSMQFHFNPSYTPTESALDLHEDFTRGQDGSIPPNTPSYFDETLVQAQSFRHDTVTDQSRNFVLQALNDNVQRAYLARPENLSAASTQRKVTLSFQDNSIFEQGHQIERRVIPDTNWVTLPVVANNRYKNAILQFIDSLLTPNTQYEYRIHSFAGTRFSKVRLFPIISTLSSIAPDTISVATRWDDSVSIIKPMIITGHGELTIEPGLRITATGNGSIIVKPGGRLNLIGTPTQKILFTSAGSEKWKGISLSAFPQPMNGMTVPIFLRHVIIENAKVGVHGAAGYNLASITNHPTISIGDTRIRNCDIGISGEGFVTLIVNNTTIENCSTGIALRNMNLPIANGVLVHDSIRGCETALYMWNTSYATIDDCVFEGFDGRNTGIVLNAFSFLAARSSKIFSYQTGVFLADRNYMSASCCDITQNYTGVILNGESANFEVKGSLIHDNTAVELYCIGSIPNLDQAENGLYDLNVIGNNLSMTKARFPVMATKNYWGGTTPRISAPVPVIVDPRLYVNPGLNCDLFMTPADSLSKKGKYDRAIKQLTSGNPNDAWDTFLSVYDSPQDSVENYWAFAGLIGSGLAKTGRDINAMISSTQGLNGTGGEFISDRNYTADLGTAFTGNTATALYAIATRLTSTTTRAESLGCNLVAKEFGYLPIWQYPNDSLESDPNVIQSIWDVSKLAVIDINNLLHHSDNQTSSPKRSAQSRNYTLQLGQNYPNPFNPVTTISYSIPSAQRIQLSVYDVLGRVVKVLVDQVKDAGEYQSVFDASGIPSGMYYYRLNSSDFSLERKMIVLK